MSKTLVRGAVIGGLVVFIWGIISWMVLPIHKHCFKKFSDESWVAEVISKNAPEDGIYVLPNTFSYTDQTSRKEIDRGIRMLEEGPFMFASVRSGGIEKMGMVPLLVALITQMIGAWIVTWMLMQTKGLKFKKQVAFITLFGIGVGVLSQLPNWNWWKFSGSYTFAIFLDLAIGWFLAGLAIAKINKAK